MPPLSPLRHALVAASLCLPPADDVGLFPCVDDADAMRKLAVQHLERGCPWAAYQWPEAPAWHRDAAYCHAAWDALDDARRAKLNGGDPRPALAKLRKILGHDCYYRGAMPPPAPLCWWRRME